MRQSTSTRKPSHVMCGNLRTGREIVADHARRHDARGRTPQQHDRAEDTPSPGRVALSSAHSQRRSSMGSLRFPSPSLAAAASSSRCTASKPAHPHATRERLLSTARARAPSRAVEKSRLLLLIRMILYYYYYYYYSRAVEAQVELSQRGAAPQAASQRLDRRVRTHARGAEARLVACP